MKKKILCFEILIIIVLLAASLDIYAENGKQASSNIQSSESGQGGGQGSSKGDNRRGGQGSSKGDNRRGDQGSSKGGDRGDFEGSGQGGSQAGFPGGHQSGGMSGGLNGRAGSAGNSIIKYSSAILAYAALFIGAFLFFLYLLVKKKLDIAPGKARNILLVMLAAGLLLRLVTSMLFEGHPYDLGIFKNWASSAADNLFQVYSSGRVDYPPAYMYVLWAVGKLTHVSVFSSYSTLLTKLPSILADLITSCLIYRLSKKNVSPGTGVLLSAFYLFNPAILVNSAVWGQVDSFFTLIIVAAVLLLAEEKPALACAAFILAVLMKPQGIIFCPVLLFALLKQRNIVTLLKAAGSALLAAVAVVLPFALHNGPFWIISLYTGTLSEYRYASVNAFNLFSLLGANFKDDSSTFLIFSYHQWGMAAIVLITVFAGFLIFKGRKGMVIPVAALVLITGVFDFSTRMHERYLFPAVALAILAFIYAKDKRFLYLAAGFSMTIFANTYYVLYETCMGVNSVAYGPVLLVTSTINVLLFLYLIKVAIEMAFYKKRIAIVLPQITK